MNYEKIDTLIHSKGVSKMKFYEAINLTHTGFAKMMQNKTFTVETLEKVAKYFEVAPSFFFDENEKIVSFSASDETTVTELYRENIELNRENRSLTKEIISLQDKLHLLEKSKTLSDFDTKYQTLKTQVEGNTINLRQVNRIQELTIDRIDKIETVLEAQLRNSQTNKALKAVDKKGNSDASVQEPTTKPHNK